MSTALFAAELRAELDQALAAYLESFSDLNRRSAAEADLREYLWDNKVGLLRALEDREKMHAALNTPETENFVQGVMSEVPHQNYRWDAEHDATKTAWDWYWTLGYLGGKAAHAALIRDFEKARHHTITAAAMLANWHRRLMPGRAGASIADDQAEREDMLLDLHRSMRR